MEVVNRELLKENECACRVCGLWSMTAVCKWLQIRKDAGHPWSRKQCQHKNTYYFSLSSLENCPSRIQKYCTISVLVLLVLMCFVLVVHSQAAFPGTKYVLFFYSGLLMPVMVNKSLKLILFRNRDSVSFALFSQQLEKCLAQRSS